MGISTIGGTAISAAGAGEFWFMEEGTRAFSLNKDAGVYLIKMWAADSGIAPQASFLFANSSNQTIASSAFVNNPNLAIGAPTEAVIRATGAFTAVSVSTNKNSWFMLERLDSYKTGSVVSTTNYSTSQTIVFPTDTFGVLIGGGGGGQGGSINGSNGLGTGGNGGGSGFARYVDIPAGTHALIVGAGGAGGTGTTNYTGGNPGNVGGTSTLLEFAAAGGNTGGQALGGSNGGPGRNGNGPGTVGASFGTPGDGPLPWFAVGGPGGTPGGSSGAPGGGGGLYGGGGGGHGTGQNSAGGGGGGGGGVESGVGGSSRNGGAGGAGGLLVISGV